MIINWLIYTIAFLSGILVGLPLYDLSLHNFKFKNKKITKLMEDFNKATKYGLEGIHSYREDIYVYRYDLPYIKTTIELDMYAKDVHIIHKPDDIDELQLFEYIIYIQNRVHNYESVNETMTRLLT